MFGGGSGGGVSITPVAFMVVGNGQIRMLPVNPETTVYDRIFDMIPTAIDKISDSISKVRGKNGKNKQSGNVSSEDVSDIFEGFSENDNFFDEDVL